MKNAMKKLLCLALALVLLIGVMPGTAYARGNQDGDGKKVETKWEDSKRPQNQKPDLEEEEEPENAPTTLTVVFKVDGEPVEQKEITPANSKYAVVQDLITYHCDVDDTQTLYYKQAYNMTTGKYVNLGSSINVGEEVHIAFSTKEDEQNDDQVDSAKNIHMLVKVDGTAVFENDKIPANSTYATVKNLLTYVFDEAWETKYKFNNAYNMTTKADADLNDGVGAGQEIHINLLPKENKEEEKPSHPGNDNQVTNKPGNGNQDNNRPGNDNEHNKYTVTVDYNYNGAKDKTITVDAGTRMKAVLNRIDDPARKGYTFAGWTWDAKGRDDVDNNDKVTKNVTIYAQWNKKNSDNDVLLKIYVNGNTKSAAKVVDLDDYDNDGKITLAEATKVVEKYFEAKSSKDDMDVDGLFTSKTWNDGRYNMRNAEKTIRVNEKDDTIIYVMVRDAQKISTSNATADTTNPKTGDTIFMAVTVMALSATALAAVYVFNKKRAVK